MSVRVLTLFDLEPVVPPEPPAATSKRAAESEEQREEGTIQEPVAAAAAETTSKKAVRPKKETPSVSAPAEKNYYSIGETAKMFDVRTSHIRFWTVQFGLKMRTTRKGDRLYTPENIEQLRLIHHLVKEQGFTIAGAKSKLKNRKGVKLEDLKKSNILDVAQALKEKLLALRKQI